jgi:triosephosphate isomerase (TIM)
MMADPTRRPLVAGNWKMNGLKASAAELGKVMQGMGDLWTKVDLMICPPATLIMTFAHVALGSKIEIGGQDCHAEPSGAFTGDISAEMLADLGAKAVIVGHSERRTLHKETDAEVRAKAQAAWRAGLTAIICIGETRAEREAGQTLDVLGRQLDGSLPGGVTAARLVVAYEPVWAIGTGLTPTAADVAQAHEFIRRRIIDRHGAAGNAVRILYGGSVKPSNAKELMAVANVDGALVGGASLKAEDFLGIAAAYR